MEIQNMEELAEVQESAAAPAAEETTTEAVDTSFSPDDIESEPEGLLSEPEPDEEEIDHDGEKFKVPKKLKDAFMRQQDYTVKTQTLAEQRKAFEATTAQHEAEYQQRVQSQQQNLAEYAEVHSIDAQLKQYGEIDWNALTDADPVQAMKLDRQMRQLQQRRGEVVASVTAKQQTQHLQAQQETAKRLQEGRAVLEREIKGWSPEVAKQLNDYGQELGFTAAELAQVNNPLAVKLLHKAYQFDQLMKKQVAEKPKPVTQEKPVTRITASKGTAAKDPANMSDKEFAEWRSRQIAQRN